jgi:hypothetical protein
MLNLEHPTENILKEYYDLFKDSVLGVLNDSKLNSSSKDYIETHLQSILTALPEEILIHHYKLITPLLSNCDDLQEFEKMKRKPKNEDKLRIYKRCSVIYSELGKIFNYKGCISSNKKISYKIAEWQGTMTCTYCNRNYTNTIISKNNKKISRPHFDHWYPNSKYPTLALSYFNLIPSCYICNSTFKRDEIYSLKEHVHPYIKEDKEVFSFSFYKESLTENRVKLRTDQKLKINNNLSKFRIQEVYDSHSSTVLQDLLDLRYKYSDNYLKILFEDTFKLGVGREQAYRLIFGVEPKPTDFHKKPFSKFKSDILRELGIEM